MLWRSADLVWTDVSGNVGHIPEDSILHSHRCENLKSYMLIHVMAILYLTLNRITILSAYLSSEYWGGRLQIWRVITNIRK
jgi:hypothetical protein